MVGCAGAAPPTTKPTASPSPAATSSPIATPTTAPTASASPRPSPSPSATPAGPLQIVTGGALGPTGVRLWYSPAKITVAQSDAMFELVNPSGGGHNLLISTEVGGEVLAGQSVDVNQTAILDATDVPPGTYKMWCSIPEHVGYGMVGTLTITQ
jgi:plastocyanin